MAVSDSWFYQWGPPSHIENLFTSEPLTHSRDPPRTPYRFHALRNMKNALPYILTMGLLSPAYQFSDFPSAFNMQYEQTGPFTTIYSWKSLDFNYSSESERLEAISSGRFIMKNNLPLGIETWKDRIFISMPKWKPGVPVTLAWLPRYSNERSPKLNPYPNWEWHSEESCSGITSVFRMQADDCGRLWVLDSGQIDVTIEPNQICPPQILIFDLKSDQLIRRHVLKKDFIKEDGLYSNIVVDVRDGDCTNVHAYITDVWRFGLVVYSYEKDKSWRISNHLFFPEPLAAAYKLHDLDFYWTDGIFGLALSPYSKKHKDRILYFHPMSGFMEYYVKTSVICNETGWYNAPNEYKILGQNRGPNGQVSASAMDRNGILYFNLVTRDSVGCWDSRKPYTRKNIGIVARNNVTMIFPNDLRLDKKKRQGIWILTNRLPFYLYRQLDEQDTNFRIMHAYTDLAIKDSICDPNMVFTDSFDDLA